MKQKVSSEEYWNTITHGFGFLLSVIGFIYVFFYKNPSGVYENFSLLLYTISLCCLYLSSTLYHYTIDEKKKQLYRKLDHITIYFLIAGTYAPVTLIALINSKGKLLFIIVWSLAIIGMILKIFFTGKYEFLSVTLYLLMGWSIVIDYQALQLMVPDIGLNYLFYGGVAYTFGIIFYAIKKIPYNHTIWHLFVLAGSIFHYFFIVKYIM